MVRGAAFLERVEAGVAGAVRTGAGDMSPAPANLKGSRGKR